MTSSEDAKKFAGGPAYALGLACIVLASFAFRIYVSRRCSLWLDEVWTRHDAASDWLTLLRGPSREHPPLLYVLVRLTVDVFGKTNLALRGVSLFFGCVVLVAVDLLCLELAFTPAEALVAVAACALAPFFMRHAAQARHYALVSACTTLELVFVLRLLRDPANFRALVGCAVCAAGAALTHYFGLAYACALLAALAFGTFPAWKARLKPFRVPPRTAAVLIALGLVLVAVALRALLLASFYRTHALGGRGRDLESSILLEFSFFQRWSRHAAAQAFLAGAGLVLLGLRTRGVARVLPFALGLPPLGLALSISSGHPVEPRYLAPSWVLYQLGSSTVFIAAWRALRGGTTPWARALRSLVAAPVVALPLALRVAEYPAGYGTGAVYFYAGLQHYFANGLARDTALVVYPTFPGKFIVSEGYPVDAPLVSLEEFAPVPGVEHYLVAEFERGSQVRDFERLLALHFRLSPQKWRSLPFVRLEHSRFQLPVRARLVTLPE